MSNIETITSRLGLDALNAMQREAIEAISSNNDDVVILSPTGSGKTLAYLLPLSQKIETDKETLQAVVIVPGRELALQSAQVCESMKCGIRAMSLYGGRPAMDDHRMIKKTLPHIVFCTPGRFNDHVAKGNITTDSVKTVVIDEFDKCLEMGFKAEMQRLLSQFSHPHRRILLSATDSEFIYQFVNTKHLKRINAVDSQQQVPARVTVNIVHSEQKDKIDCLVRLLRSLKDSSSIVFLNYRNSVERVAAALSDVGFTVSSFHGGLSQDLREAALYRFTNASANILVSTDLGSRGLDIPDVDNIIHYHLPLGGAEYVHRVGRSARWTASGQTFFILSAEEQLPDYIKADTFDYPIPDNLPSPMPPRMITLYIGKGKCDKLSKGDIVGFLCKKGGLTAQSIGRIDVKERYTYVAVDRKKAADTLKLLVGEKIKGMKTIVETLR